MAAFSDPFPVRSPVWLPAALAAHSEANINALLEGLSDESRELYVAYLADEVASMTRSWVLPAWLAFDRASCEVQRRNKERKR